MTRSSRLNDINFIESKLASQKFFGLILSVQAVHCGVRQPLPPACRRDSLQIHSSSIDWKKIVSLATGHVRNWDVGMIVICLFQRDQSVFRRWRPSHSVSRQWYTFIAAKKSKVSKTFISVFDRCIYTLWYIPCCTASNYLEKLKSVIR